jgi:hypothetical protein
MRRALLLVTLATVAAAPAQASDAQLHFVVGRTLEKLAYVAKRIDVEHPQSLARFGARLARLARRGGRLISHLAPSTHDGAVMRHKAVAALRELRVAGRLIVLAMNARGRHQERLLLLGIHRMTDGLGGLVASVVGL